VEVAGVQPFGDGGAARSGTPTGESGLNASAAATLRRTPKNIDTAATDAVHRVNVLRKGILFYAPPAGGAVRESSSN
jgi:hypothetical protein